MDHVSEIKARLSISDVCRDYGTLHPGGSAGKFKMICPFHDDHDPSMVVNEQKGFAWCFACNSGGDIFSFVQRIENCSFPEALRLLAGKAGVEIAQEQPGKRKEKEDEKEQLFDLMEEAASFFEKQLAASERARQTLSAREIPDEILRKFRVGFAPDAGHSLEKHLLEKGFSRKEMILAGVLAVEDSKGESTKDKFRNRIMFPIWNSRGRICAFGGRYIGDYAQAPKYLNSPETELYKKSGILYGYHLAKEVIREQKFAILTEGYFDVLACFAAGVQNAVAVAGTAFTDGHAKLISRMGKAIAFALDVDEAGQAATRRSTVIALKNRLEVEIVSIPGGKDPDEAIRENRTEFLRSIDERKPYMEAFITRSFLHRDAASLEDKKKILDELLPVLNAIPRGIERDHYAGQLADRMGSRLQVLEEELRHFARYAEPTPLKRTAQKHERKISSLEYIIGMIFSWPDFFSIVKEHFLADLLPESDEKTIYNVIEHHYTKTGLLSPEEVWSGLSDKEADKWRAMALYTEEQTGTFPEALRKEELLKIVLKLNMSLIPRKMTELGTMLRAGSGDSQEIITQMNELTKLLHKFHQQ